MRPQVGVLKDGRPVYLEVIFLGDDPRGWVIYESRLFDNDDGPNTRDNSLGHIKFTYIPKSNFKKHYPNPAVYAVKIQGKHFLQDNPLFKIDPVELIRQESPSLLKDFKKFRDFWVDKPMPDYASAKIPRMGVGTILYVATNDWIKSHLGLHLWSSTSQTDDAKGIWSKFKSQGITTMEPRPRLLAAASHVRSIALMKFLSMVARREGVAEHIYVVGGAVRNHILNVPIKDIDVVVDSVSLGRGRDSEWFAKQVAEAIPTESNLTTNQYGVAILTVKGEWVVDGEDLDGEVIEIANARKESYDGASGKGKGYKPTDVSPATIKEDVYRREFTFNSLLFRLLDLADGPEKAEVIDITGLGLRHLEEKLISTPMDPDKTFSDDPTRQLRILKFLLRYNLKIAPEVVASVKRNAHKLKDMPWEAVAKILTGDILDSPQAMKGMKVMKDLGILDVLVEMIKEVKPFAAYLTRQLASGNHSVELLMELADLGVAGRVMSFLDPGQRVRFKRVSDGMGHQESRDFLNSLSNPQLESAALIEEFNLQGRDRASLVTHARHLLLEDPSLAMDPASLTDAIRRRLRSTQRVAAEFLSLPD